MIKAISRLYTQGRWQKWIIPLIAIITVLTCIQQVVAGNYNNINIFRYSSLHLLAHQPLYIEYPQSYFDYFLYHPSFCVLFIPFAFLPAAVTLFAWTILSVAVFIRTIQIFPGLTSASKHIVLLLVLPELINNEQYVQTNIFLSSVLLLTFIYLERGRLFWAAFFTILAFCIKGYGGMIGLLFLLYPGKLKFISYSLFWGLLVTALPLLFVSFHETVIYYTDWLRMISSDEIKEGMSIVGKWGKTHVSEMIITITGLILLLFNFLMVALNQPTRNIFYFRTTLCCYLLVWLVLFNRAAETPTYMLAITGMALWLGVDGPSRANVFFITLVLLSGYYFASDLFPPFIHHFFRTYHLKPYAFMAFFAWLQYRLIISLHRARGNASFLF